MMFEPLGWIEPLLRQHLLQVCLVAAGCLLLVRLMARRHPHFCYAILLLAMVKCLFPPLVTGPLGMAVPQLAARSPSGSFDPVAEVPPPEQTGFQQGIGPGPSRPSRLENLPPVLELAANSGASPVRKQRRVRPPERGAGDSTIVPFLTRVCSFGWILLVACVIRVWHIRRRLARQIHDGQTRRLRPLFDRVCGEAGLKGIGFQVTDCEIGPAAFGFWRPTVVIPGSLAISASQKELEILFSHEVTHIRRRDIAIAGFQTLAVCLWWFNPLVWALSRQLSRFREYCCDLETMARQGIGSREYCVCLLNSINPKCRGYSRFGMGASPFMNTKQRMEIIMMNHRQPLAGTPKRVWIVVALLGIFLLPGAAPGVKKNQGTEGVRTEKGVVFYATAGGITAVDSGTGDSRQVFPRHQNMEHPVVSPAGRRVAHASWVDGQRKVWVARADGRPQPVSPDHGQEFIRQIGWSPDGQWIAYRTQSTSRSAVYLVKPDGSGHRQLKTFDGKYGRGLEYYNDFCWSPDSRTLAIAKVVEINIRQFASTTRVTRKSVLELYEVATNRRLAKNGIADRHPISDLAWSPDGQWIAYQSDRSLMVTSAEKKVTRPRVLVESINPASFPKWDPDSRAILVHDSRGNSPGPPGSPPPPVRANEFLIVDLQQNVQRIPADCEIWNYDWLPGEGCFVASGSDRAVTRFEIGKSDRNVTKIADDAGFWASVQVVNARPFQPSEKSK